jgi:branched-chain amino acid transport system substrate-binding protein
MPVSLKLGRLIGLALTAFAFVTATAGHAEIAIAVAGPMTGRYSRFGSDMRAGAELAVVDLNKRGGIAGEMIVLKVADDGCERETAASTARNMVADNVRLVVGHYCESASLAAGAVYAGADLIQILPAALSGSSSGPRLGPNAFRLSGKAPDQDEVAARSIASLFAGKRIAILHDRTRYGLSHAGSIKDALVSAPLAGATETVLFAPIVAGEKDYGAVVGTLKDAGADVVYFGGFPTEAALLIRQMREAGLAAPLMGPDTLAAREFWDLAGAAGEGTLVTSLSDRGATPYARKIDARLKGTAAGPASLALRSYVAVMIWAAGASSAGSLKAQEAGLAIASATHPTPLGPVTFNEQGDGDLPSYALSAWRRGALEPIEGP